MTLEQLIKIEIRSEILNRVEAERFLIMNRIQRDLPTSYGEIIYNEAAIFFEFN